MLAGEFADDGLVVFKVVEADGTGWLGEGDGSVGKHLALGGGHQLERGRSWLFSLVLGGGGAARAEFGGVDVQGHVVEEFLRHSSSLDAQDFQVDFTGGYSSAEASAQPSLVEVHEKGGQGGDEAEDGEDHDGEDPESSQDGVRVSIGIVSDASEQPDDVFGWKGLSHF